MYILIGSAVSFKVLKVSVSCKEGFTRSFELQIKDLIDPILESSYKVLPRKLKIPYLQ